MLNLLDWQLWMCWAEAGYVEATTGHVILPLGLSCPLCELLRAGPRVAPLSPSLDILPGRGGALLILSKGTRAGHTPGLTQICSLPPP